MSTRINYTAAERRSFELQAETCDTVESAIDDAFKPPSLDAPGVSSILRHHGFDPDDAKLRSAIAEVMLCAAFPVKQQLAGIIIHRATMPLRAALVDQVRANMEAAGEASDTTNHFRDWVASWEEMQAIREARQAGAQP